ncbi:glutathione S-transferase N-terminal domain-containing protein [Vibrio algivorus]|uniref:Glutaredoxin n=1 Tax=Vibrio algivorus TaxID=1667024 RepID=A0A557NUW0_9VIBR|nr:glutathione S-transferase N-terminal domain-containing protein [Vibrio algivorus]TVO32196.1 glutaredoxin [Vibrio algivorus]GLT13377.1 glutaredoxin [Vibrio algivorus]
MAVIRWILGRIILLLNFIFSPRGVKRTPEAQQVINERTQQLALYQFDACPFCVKVRRAMKRNSLNIELRDAKTEPHRQTLQDGGGRVKVPCLRIEKEGEVTWMYESNDIIQYLEQEIAQA